MHNLPLTHNHINPGLLSDLGEFIFDLFQDITNWELANHLQHIIVMIRDYFGFKLLH